MTGSLLQHFAKEGHLNKPTLNGPFLLEKLNTKSKLYKLKVII